MPAAKVVEQKQGLDLKEPAKKVPVVNKDKLTPDEQQAVKDAIKEANKDLGLTDDDITVDDKGNVTVNKDGKEGQLPAAKVVEQKQGLDLTAPVLTEVNDPNALTPDEQKAVIAAVKAANPNLSPKARVEVQKDGTVVVMDDGKVGILTPDKTIKKKEASSAQTKNSFILVPAGQTQGTEAQQEVREHKAYIFGYEDGSVRPMGNITRAEAATMVARLMNYDLTDNSKPNFTDTNGWYNASINAVVKAGIMKGYENGSFKPDAPISRAEFAQLIKGIDKANSGDVPFRDVKGHWAQEAIAQAYANGRISGYPDGTFRPNQKITRAEAAKILNSVFERAVYEAGLDGVHADVKHFADLDKGAWYYYDMVEATNSHHFVRQDAQKVDENWKRVDK